MIPTTTRRTIEVFAIMAALFYAGFRAWSEEHSNVIAALAARDNALGQIVQLQKQNGRLRDETRTYVPRRLPNGFQEKLKALVEADSALRGQAIHISVGASPDADSASLAGALARAMRASGFDSVFAGLGPQEGKEVGFVFYLRRPDAPSEQALHVMNALRSAGLTLTIISDDPGYPEPPGFTIFVTRDTPALQ